MKQSLVLWISALIITFIIIFIQNRISPTYPSSGTIGIGGQKVTYQFKKVHNSSNDYKIFIRSDLKELKGILKWKSAKSDSWNIDTMKNSEGNIFSSIPKTNYPDTIEYKICLIYGSQEYFLPVSGTEKIIFLGDVPKTIMLHYFLTLFVGLLLAVRGGMEYFNEKPRLKLYSIFTLISFFSCAMIFASVQKAYQIGAIGKFVPPLEQIFENWLIAIVVLWLCTLIAISFLKNPKKWILISSLITVLVFLFHI